MSENVPDVVHSTAKSLEVPVAEFEGEMIRRMVGKIKVPDLEMPVGYQRGTHLKLEIEVRVRDVSIKEVGPASDRQLVREHTLVVEDSAIRLIGAYTADELDPGVGGSAAASGHDLDGDGAEEGSEEGEGDDEFDPGF